LVGARSAAADDGLSTADARPRPLPLFAQEAAPVDWGPGAALLRGFALPYEHALAAGLQAVAASAPFRHMLTPGGFRMSVAMTSCGDYGCVSSESG
jgi:alkylated DNA repair dioxygenase AlkB